mmetsp:Transcript_28654/g.81978  ORF Transcript_28654/g.81978 Transcript_28654/m.81978 type:complete len:219 (+) Transcript_28654:815-1471(+)
MSPELRHVRPALGHAELPLERAEGLEARGARPVAGAGEAEVVAAGGAAEVEEERLHGVRADLGLGPELPEGGLPGVRGRAEGGLGEGVEEAPDNPSEVERWGRVASKQLQVRVLQQEGAAYRVQEETALLVRPASPVGGHQGSRALEPQGDLSKLVPVLHLSQRVGVTSGSARRRCSIREVHRAGQRHHRHAVVVQAAAARDAPTLFLTNCLHFLEAV